MLALADDGHLQGRQGSVIIPCRRQSCFGADFFRGTLKGFEPSYKNRRQYKEPFRSGVILCESSQDPDCHELAERRPGEVDVLPVIQMCLLMKELGTVDKQAVY